MQMRWRVLVVLAVLLLVACLWRWALAQSEPYPPPTLHGVVVAIDPGHGGVDAGAASRDHRILEKDLTLHLSLLLRAELEKAGAVVVMTRETDVDPSGLPWRNRERYRSNLRTRTDVAAKVGAAAFISLHMDATRLLTERGRGPSTYYGTGNAGAVAGAITCTPVLRRCMR